MNKEIAGYVWIDVYLLLEKVTFNNFNVSITDKGITLDMLLSEFEDLDSYSLPDLYAGARRYVKRYAEAVLSLNKYIDALGEYAKDVIEQMFDSCTFDVWKTSYTSDVEVSSDGIATIYMNSNVWFDGVNLSLPRDKIVAEIKQRIDNRHSGDLAGIGNTLIEVVVDVHID